jgi:hypothetical protein
MPSSDKIFVNQSQLTIRVNTGINLSGATCAIRYKKPNQLKGEWAATVVDAAEGIIEYRVTNTKTLDVSGVWKARAACTFPGGGIALGQIASFAVSPEEA